MKEEPMKVKRFEALLLLSSGILYSLVGLGSSAQQATPTPAQPPMPAMPVTPNTNLVSPEVHSDGTVTLRVWAPDAKEVKLISEGEESVPGATPDHVMAAMRGVSMTKTEDGVWSVSIGPYPSGAYRYAFVVDGVHATDPKNATPSESLSEVRSLFVIPGGFSDAKDVPHGSVATVFYQSRTLGRMRRMHVYLPPGYEQGKEQYPVFYLLHGGGDCDDSWTSVGRANFILDNLIAAGQAKPMIVVMPAGHVSTHMDFRAMGADVAADPFSNDFLKDLIPYVEQHYRVIADAQHRAIAGLSMGGVQALNVSVTHPGFFSYVGVFSSGWFGPVRDQFEQANAAQLQSPEKSKVKLLWFDAGKYDIALPNTGPTADLLKKYGYSPEVHQSDGFHAWNNWRDYLHEFAPRLFQ
jgi:enterochelin esterase family protein